MLFVGAPYGRGAAKVPSDAGCELGPAAIRRMYPEHGWTMLAPTWPFDMDDLMSDRFGENLRMQEIVYDYFARRPYEKHFFVGGDHSLNFAHFKSVAEKFKDEDVALVYLDAHTDIHTPETSLSEASFSPHGTNVRHLLGEGDPRFLALGKSRKVLGPENLFYVGARSFEPSEFSYVWDNGIFMTDAARINDPAYLDGVARGIMERIGGRKYVLSFDFDMLDSGEFGALQVPEANGVSVENALRLIPKLVAPNMVAAEFVEYAPTLGYVGDSAGAVKGIINAFLENI
jgi:arginase